MEIRTKTLIFQSKHRMDFAPVGIDTRLAFWLSVRQINRDGTLPAAITVLPLRLCVFRGKLVLGYSEIELVTTGSGYQFIHAADMMYCADNHLRSELSWQLQALNIGHFLFLYTIVSSALSDEDRRQWLHVLQAADQNRTLVVGSGLCQGSFQGRETRLHHRSSESPHVSCRCSRPYCLSQHCPLGEPTKQHSSLVSRPLP